MFVVVNCSVVEIVFNIIILYHRRFLIPVRRHKDVYIIGQLFVQKNIIKFMTI